MPFKDEADRQRYEDARRAGRREYKRRKQAEYVTRLRAAGQYKTYKLRNEHGITEAEYWRLLEAQGGGCAICGTKTPGGRGDHFHVDHDHRGQGRAAYRGLLCHGCNTGIGNLQDSPDVLRRAADYLESPPGLASVSSADLRPVGASL